ncbi:hypothetical protein BN13_30095 [Nostocoides jenkinsii Ben 74]|uniref:Uncharacterized protein n=1 Tax=Nostocoides jenkinsii Ben 74 TaxID=1193518 RepID=A0A077ME52_9MICO|nr:hypothetical protein BN13_30095 [Tetrasphaera jenkinsii Ben 74]
MSATPAAITTVVVTAEASRPTHLPTLVFVTAG